MLLQSMNASSGGLWLGLGLVLAAVFPYCSAFVPNHSEPLTLFLNKKCWATKIKCGVDHVMKVRIPEVEAMKIEHPTDIPGNPIFLLSDWDLHWVAKERENVSPKLAALGEAATVIVTFKDGESAVYNFIHTTVSQFRFLQFIILTQLEMVSPATGALMINEANKWPNVKLLTTLVGNTNLYVLKTMAAQLVTSPYTIVRSYFLMGY